MSAIDTPFNDPYLALLYHPQSPSASASHPSSSPIRAALLPSTNARRVSASSVSPSRPHSILPSLYASSIRRQSDSAIKHQTHVMNPDVLASTPAPVTRFLILSAPLIRFLRSSLEVILWRDKEGKAKSITLLAGWWALCLLGWGIVRYMLPPFLLFLYLYPSLPTISSVLTSAFSPHGAQTLGLSSLGPVSPPSQPSTSVTLITWQAEPATSQSLLQTVAEFSAFHSLLAQAWPAWLGSLKDLHETVGHAAIGRALIGAWATWIVGGWLFGVRVLIGIIGTIILLLPSPYFPPLVTAFQTSRTLRKLFAILSFVILGGSCQASFPISETTNDVHTPFWTSLFVRRELPLSESAQPSSPASRGRSGSLKAFLGLAGAGENKSEDIQTETGGSRKAVDVPMHWEEQPLLYRFEIVENQRWWLALDWTATLAPGDRPVWCDTHLHPTLPPTQFTLPPSSKIVIPSSTQPKTYQEERTTCWRWIDDDWAVLRNYHPVTGADTGSVNTTSNSGGGGAADLGRGFTTFVPAKTISTSASLSALGGSDVSSTLLSNSSTATGGGSGGSGGIQARMSLGEQALSKGLERLKAATAHATSSASPMLDSTTLGSPTKGSSATNVGMGHSTSSPGVDGDSQRTLFATMSAAQAQNTSNLIPTTDGEMITAKELDELNAPTDDLGWSYGGNKWEGLNARGGLGKFTRRRTWIRRALCVESVLLIPLPQVLESKSSGSSAIFPSSLPTTSAALNSGREQESPPSPSSRKTPSRSSSISRRASGLDPGRSGSVGSVEVVSAASTATGPIPFALSGSKISDKPREGSGTSTTEALRQRLKKAVES